MIDERIARWALKKSKGISYRESGAGPALVCLHGIGAASAGWLLQLETLQGYRLIAWDAPGYGESDFLPLEITRWTHRHLRPQGYRQALHCLAQGSLVSEARRYGKKVLVACGSEDVITPEAGCKKIAAAFARGEYRTLPGIGHVPHMEAAEAVNRLIAGFVPK